MFFENNRKNKVVSVDIIIPIYNEDDVIPLLINRLNEVFSIENRKKYGISETTYLFIDDGSKDKSVPVLVESLEGKSDIKFKIIRFSRNFGHQSAVSAGIEDSQSDLAAVIDADLQDPPELILDMVNKWREGYEVVFAQRTNRKEHLMKRFFYWLFYRIYNFLAPIDVAMDSGDFCLMSQPVITEIKKLPESIRFPRGLRAWVGFAQTGIPYDRPERAAGKTKYSFRKLYQLATDGITSISIRPLKVTQFFTIIYFLASLFVLIVILINIVHKKSSDQSFLLLLAVILISNALVLLCLYVMSAYIGRSYLEGKGRPNHIIQEIIDLETIKKNEQY